MKTMLVALFMSTIAAPAFSLDEASPYDAFVSTTASILDQLIILKDAGQCQGPFGIGRRVASEMDHSIASMTQERADIDSAVKKGSEGKPVVDQYEKSAEKDKEQMSQNLDMVLYGLSGDSPACKTASSAFQRLYDLSSTLPDLLTQISKSL